MRIYSMIGYNISDCAVKLFEGDGFVPRKRIELAETFKLNEMASRSFECTNLVKHQTTNQRAD